jgi:hypothetical protein
MYGRQGKNSMEKERIFEAKFDHVDLPDVGAQSKFWMQGYVSFGRPVMQKSQIRNGKFEGIHWSLSWAVFRWGCIGAGARSWR